jgi:V/A-type H+-transporting ATPase subunit E
MSLDTVVEEVREEARAEADEIVAEAEQEADEIVAEAEAEAEERIAEAEAAAERAVEREREQATSGAKLEAKQQRLEARRDALEDTRDAVEERIADIDGERREELTRALLDAGLDEFDAGPVRVSGHPDDADLLAELAGDASDERSVAVEYDGEHDCLGGVVLESDATRVRVDNTFDAILETVWDDELQAVSERLFD